MKDHFDIKIQGEGKPKILIIGCVHGDERIGQKVINDLRQLKINKGSLITILANTTAIKNKVRFLDQDLNRSFPGKRGGNHEEHLAYELLPVLRKADIVIDIHSTTTETRDAIILTKINDLIRSLLDIINPRRVVLMPPRLRKVALSGHVKAGISLEYGKENDPVVLNRTLRDVKRVLAAYGMIKQTRRHEKRKDTQYYKVLTSVPKSESFKLERNIKNFVPIKKGAVISRCGSKVQTATTDLIPFLVGPKAYKDIWGFAAREVDKL